MFEVFWSPLPDFVADHTPCLAFSISRRYCMTQNTTTAKAHKATPVGTFNMRMGNTTYVIGVHFSKESKDTLEDKMKRLMRDDVKAANFWIENNLWLFRFLSWRNASEWSGEVRGGYGNQSGKRAPLPPRPRKEKTQPRGKAPSPGRSGNSPTSSSSHEYADIFWFAAHRCTPF